MPRRETSGRSPSRSQSQPSDASAERTSGSFAVAAPKIELPKGGGALRGIDEKFTANPATGTASLSVPIATSPGRSGFGPQLALAYDSGSGNGPFGLGFSLNIPAITRKTDKGLPRYADATESDVFLLSGAEDLVPRLEVSENVWQTGPKLRRAFGLEYRVDEYRPRIEGVFARIERWSSTLDATEVFWRSITRDNVTTWYGKTTTSRIADPTDARRIYAWLACETYDDRGNAIVYGYKAENSQGVAMSALHERNRTEKGRAANRHPKSIRYGNAQPYRPDLAAEEPTPLPQEWAFEVLFDYGEHADEDPMPSVELRPWAARPDPFSSYRAGFELRTYRLCQRVLMFHHFPEELDVGANCLVRSIELAYGPEAGPANDQNVVCSQITAITQLGHRTAADGQRWRKALPPLELEYSAIQINSQVGEAEPESLENLPSGVDGAVYHWVDLDGEGLSGVLTQQAGALWYKRNLSPLAAIGGNGAKPSLLLDASESIAEQPSLSQLGAGTQLIDLAGDGTLDVVEFDGPTPGFYQRSTDGRWRTHTLFSALPSLDWRSPNLRFIDLTGDGHSDLLLSGDDTLCWYPSIGEAGFAPALHMPLARDEELGPRLVFADGCESIYLADLTGDGLTDLVRIRNGEVCYWPNLGYGRFGAKVTMDRAPRFDHPDQFDQRRVRVADIDGSGTADIVYLGTRGVDLYFNQSGNAWSPARRLEAFPPMTDFASVEVVDLFGNGTACLVWSSSATEGGTRQMRYVDLMGGQKPHLLIKSANNLGAETRFHYAPSTRFYLSDRAEGNPWTTKLPFPVQVLERVETLDRISGNRFVTRYAYHHGYFDGVEREFRGFGMVEQWDTEEITALNRSDAPPDSGNNFDAQSNVPPVLTRTWFHTGAQVFGGSVSSVVGAYREPDLSDAEAAALRLPDTLLPDGLTVVEQREACRALKGSLLRQEVYALDGADQQAHPYVVREQNFELKLLQPKASNRHAVFLSHARESLQYHYERNPADPRTRHELTLEVDDFGNVLRSAAISYGRRVSDSALSQQAQAEQRVTFVRYAEHGFTNAIQGADSWRTPLPCEDSSYEVTGLELAPGQPRFEFEQVARAGALATPLAYEEQPTTGEQKRCVEHVRTLYRPDDLGASRADPLALLPLGALESMALPGESYRLALTSGLVETVYEDRLSAAMLAVEGRYVHLMADEDWWIASGRVFFGPDPSEDAAAELAFARQHFFTPRRYRDPFHTSGFETESFVTFDPRDLLPVLVRNALGDTVACRNDYRVMRASEVTDANGNRSSVAFDALGLVVGTSVMGKPGEPVGDSLDGFIVDFDERTLSAFLADPLRAASDLLQQASTRLVYDVGCYYRTREQVHPEAPVVVVLARETHAAEPGGAATRVQCVASYSDGFGRELQKKANAEPGPIEPGGPQVDSRWVGSGWTIFNNKGMPVRRFEPFFSATHHFEREVQHGVSPIVCYDPLGRVVATVHPNHSWQKVRFDAWRQESWDVNDTVLLGAPETDGDVGDYFRRLPSHEYLPSWYDARIGGALGTDERVAAEKTARHAATPAVTHLDSLGRAFLSMAHNRVDRGTGQVVDEYPETHVVFDITGNTREVSDARGRVVMRYDYDLLGTIIHTHSMDAAERWAVNDAAGNPLRAWDSRGHELRNEFDVLHRPVYRFVRGTGPSTSDPRVFGREVLYQRLEYGEGEPNAAAFNLRTRLFKTYDAAGVTTNARYDFKGNLLEGTRRLVEDYEAIPDWSTPVLLSEESFTSGTAYDALNRPVLVTCPDQSRLRPAYNTAGLLERIDAQLRGSETWTTFVQTIDYDARAQRERILYASGNTETEYAYDPLTFRLTGLETRRGFDRAALQRLAYVYDPSGNLTSIADTALQTLFYGNDEVTPKAEYEYDAVYQLIAATGREHIGQTTQVDSSDDVVQALPHPSDAVAMRRYSERYDYDTVGNLLQMIHRSNGSTSAGDWTRRYRYAPENNRLLETSLPGDDPNGSYSARYAYNDHGSIIEMPHLQHIDWSFEEQIQTVDLAGGGRVYYQYDASGRRARKVYVHSGVIEERIYVSGFEVYRKRRGTELELERETLHVMDGQRRVALIETQTVADGLRLTAPTPVIRFQFDNHIGSACLELDANGALISYEEYHPFGTPAYRAASGGLEVSANRYRFTGKERDEETGFTDHGARQYAAWLGRWTSADPLELVDGVNRYAWVENRPTTLTDPTGTSSTDDSTQVREPPPVTSEPEHWFTKPGFSMPTVTGLQPVTYNDTGSSVGNLLVNGFVYGTYNLGIQALDTFNALFYTTVAIPHEVVQGGVVLAGGTPRDAEALEFALAMTGPEAPYVMVAGLRQTAATSTEAATVSELSAGRTAVRELVVPVPRRGQVSRGLDVRRGPDVQQLGKAAEMLAERRPGAVATTLDRLHLYSAEKVTFLGHVPDEGGVFGGHPPDYLHAVLRDAELNPAVIELGGCKTRMIAPDVAYYTRATVIGYEEELVLQRGSGGVPFTEEGQFLFEMGAGNNDVATPIPVEPRPFPYPHVPRPWR